MTRWNALALCVVLSLPLTAEAQTMTDAQPGQPACDLSALRDYSISRVLANRAIRLTNAPLHFPDPDAPHDSEADFTLFRPEPQLKAALARGLASFDPAESHVLILATLSHWARGEEPLIGLLVLDHSAHLDEILAALDAEGLPEHAAIIRKARDLFKPATTPAARYDRIYDGYGGRNDPILEQQLIDLSKQYLALPSPLDIAAERITASPELMAIYEPLRKATADEERIDWLAGKLWSCLDHYGPPDEVARRLAELPDPYDRIIVTYIFQAEMLNGGVHQFFSNSSGVLAPDVAEALDSMNLPQHAQTVRKGMALFPDPYPRDRQIRLNFMAGQDEDFDNSLHDLTYEVDDGEMSRAMIRIAREADVLPR